MLHVELIWMEWHQVRYLLIIQVKFSVVYWGHSRSPTVFANNLRSKWDRDVGLVSLRLRLTYLGHRVTLPWLDLMSNFDLDLSRSNYTWYDAPWRDKHDRVTIVVLSFKTKTLSSKNHFGQIWPFDLCTGDLNFDLSLKMIEVVSEWFFPSFRTPFSVRSTMRRSRDRRGCSNTPPPHQVVENPEAYQGAGVTWVTWVILAHKSPEGKVNLTGSKLYIIRSVLTRETQWCQN